MLIRKILKFRSSEIAENAHFPIHSQKGLSNLAMHFLLGNKKPIE